MRATWKIAGIAVAGMLWGGLAGAGTTPAEEGSSPPRPEILVLGTYHMANPGHDIYDIHADDVLAPKRQAELERLAQVLLKFHPTKVAVEADLGTRKVPEAYAEYLAGKHEPTRNEIEQVGFRVAKESGLPTIYPVDADGEFPYQRVVDYAKATGRSAELDEIIGQTGELVQEEDAFLASHTILEMLLDLNSDQTVARDMSFYYRVARFGEPGDWAGADLVADWYRRNARIYTNLLQLADSPGERVLVIFGAGHLGCLRQFVEGNPDLRLRRLSELTGPSAP
jgi:hypothetical protein